MSFQASDFLAGLFGPAGPSTAAAVSDPEPMAAPVIDPADLGPSLVPVTLPAPIPSGSDPQAADLGPSGFDPAGWTWGSPTRPAGEAGNRPTSPR
jgi:hypothetical protein